MELFYKIEQPILTGDRIKELREERGVSQEVLAARTGVARGTLARIESSGEEIKKVSDYVRLQEYFKENIKDAPESTNVNQEEDMEETRLLIRRYEKLLTKAEARIEELEQEVNELKGVKAKLSAS